MFFNLASFYVCSPGGTHAVRFCTPVSVVRCFFGNFVDDVDGGVMYSGFFSVLSREIWPGLVFREGCFLIVFSGPIIVVQSYV